MARLVMIKMNALQTVTVATIIATTQLVLTTAGVVGGTSCLLTERPVLISMSARGILTTVLRYVGTPQVPSPVVVTLAMHCRAEDIVTISTSAPAVTAVVLTLVLTTPVHSHAVVTQVTILARTENPVTIPTNVLRTMEGVGTIALIQWGLTDVRVKEDIICLGIIMLASILMNAPRVHTGVSIIAEIARARTHVTVARDMHWHPTVKHAKTLTSVIWYRTYAVNNVRIVWGVTRVDAYLGIG